MISRARITLSLEPLSKSDQRKSDLPEGERTMAFKRIGNEPHEWQQGNSRIEIECDDGRVRETRAEHE